MPGIVSIQGGIGATYILPISTSGNPPNPAFPQRVLSIADLDIQVKGKNVMLEGQNLWPDDVMPSDREATIKLTAGRVGIDTVNTMFGETTVAGFTQVSVDEGGASGTPIPISPYQITVANSATFASDLGVLNAGTGQLMQQVASGPVAGQYTVAAGVYTFSSADHTSGISVKISYSYTTAGSGRTLTIANHIQGYGPIVRLVNVCPYTSPIATSSLGVINVRACRFTSIGLPFKRNGYLMVPIEGTIYPDGSGNAIDIWSPAS
jgi:hypothetical protein